jgi:hypothetical protein
VRGSLSEFGDARIQYEQPQIKGVSPVCGCYNEQDPASWRGISFVARQMTLSGTSRSDVYTSFLVTGAFPGNITWIPWVFKMQATVYECVLPRDEPFNPAILLVGGPDSVAPIVASRAVETQYIALLTMQPLHISVLGRYPISAWIPTAKALVDISSHLKMFPDQGPSEWSITEHYSLLSQMDAKTEFPLLDIIGRDTVLWTDDPSSVVTDGEGVLIRPAANGPADKKRVIAVKITKAPFAARVAVMPLGSAEGDANSFADSFRKGMPFPFGLRTSTAELKVYTTPEDRVSFAELYRLIATKNTIHVDDIALTTPFYRFVDDADQTIDPAAIEPGFGKIPSASIKQHARTSMTFRFPPIPGVNGFNVFGPIGLLHLSDAQGHLWIRSQLIDVSAPAELEFQGIEQLAVKSGVMTLPLEVRGKDALINFKAVARVAVNGETRSTVAEKYGLRPGLEYFVIVAAAFQMLAAVIAILQYVRTSRT